MPHSIIFIKIKTCMDSQVVKVLNMGSVKYLLEWWKYIAYFVRS